MAEISQNSAGDSSDGKVRVKKLSTRIDMTPMVDLAFLLLTFFILTATFNQAHIMPLDMPDKTDDTTQVPRINHEKVLNLILAENNNVYWWIGLEARPNVTNYSKNGIRKILLEKRKQVPGLWVLIKPKDDSKYENIVDVLDEIAITGTTEYAIVAFTEEDRARIAENLSHIRQ